MKRIVGCSIGCLLVGSSIALAASVPSRRIVFGQSIAGVKLGASKAQVRAAMGKPESTAGRGSSWTYLGKGHVELLIVGFGKRPNTVVVLDTWSTTERTKKGIGPGSTVPELRKAYPQVLCEAASSTRCDFFSRYKGKETDTRIYAGNADPQTSPIADVSISYCARNQVPACPGLK
jgi:hypothetical protein